ncbi:MAG: hypothetical protein K8S94_01840 [Planctomycetia bacterium]|nr:hypothetical protein [Planctomycetia bacterium]
MNRISNFVGHLDWLLARSSSLVSRNPLAFYNCAIHIRLDTLDGASWAHPDSDRVRKKLLTLVDALANSALRAYLSLRDEKQVRPPLAKALVARGRAVVAFARKSGFPADAREQPGASKPPDINQVVDVLSRIHSESDVVPRLPDEYVEDISGGLLDVLAGAAYESEPGAAPGVGRTMKNTGAAAIELAGQKNRPSAIPATLRQHNRLAAKVLRKPS